MRILHLEDNPADAELVSRILVEEWSDCAVTVVATRDDFEAELDRGGYDLILSDFTLVSFTGLEALDLACRRAPDVPFVFFTGTLGEERAIDAVHLGAADYVLKDQMKRLVTAIRRALREAAERRQRRQAEDSLRHSEERYRKIFSGSPLPMWVYHTSTLAVLEVNDSACRHYGYAREEFLRLTIMDLRPPAEAQRLADLLAHGLADAESGVWRHRRRDGTLIDVEVFSHLLESGAADTRLVQVNDVTAQRAAERRVRELVELLDKARDGIVVSELDGRVTFWNRGAERISGWTAADARGRRIEELFGPDAADRIATARQVLDARGEWRGEFHLRDRLGNPFVVEIGATQILDNDGRPTARLTIATDITEKKKLEERLLRAQRMESIGMLAAGIAHDLNNVLSPIMMVGPMLREHMTDATDLQMLAMLEKSTERGAGLIRQILGFAQGVAGGPKVVQVKHLARDLGVVIKETFPKNIHYEERLAPNLWPIRANPTHIHQVLLNLCVNARDAMPEGGTLRLRVENRRLDEVAARALEGAHPGPWLVLHVEDTGTGIPPETLAHIWDPFFTTKESGKGTGLGLSTVRGIVESHHGFIALETAVGRGTTFHVYLPADDDARDGATGGSAQPFFPRGNGELILVVDDEINIRDATTAALAHHGYRVLTARDGTEGLALFAPRSTEISLVITDLNMPKLDGATVASVVHRLNPAVKIVIASGFSPVERATTTTPPQFADALLAKPFAVETLLTTVSRLLQQTSPRSAG